MGLKLYSVSDGPPSLSVQQCLKALGLAYNLINIDFNLGEHMREEYAKLNPQKEIPVLDDDGFYLSERWPRFFFDYNRTPLSLKKTNMVLDVFNTYLERLGTKYAAGDNVTIADFQLITATMCLEAINFDLSPYPLVKKWYETFKSENPDLWAIAEKGMKQIKEFELNPPDLSHMEHPIHPVRKNK